MGPRRPRRSSQGPAPEEEVSLLAVARGRAAAGKGGCAEPTASCRQQMKAMFCLSGQCVPWKEVVHEE